MYKPPANEFQRAVENFKREFLALTLAAHSGKTAVRAVVTASPEPVSNVALSFGEDVVAVALTWFATRHPLIAAAIVAVLLVIIVITIRFVVRSLRKLLQRARAALKSA